MKVPLGDHSVTGMKFRRRIHAEWPFIILDDYRYTWKNAPLGAPANDIPIKDKAGNVVATLHRASGATLKAEYAWDGNSGPALNTFHCARASALHDLWCQAMSDGTFERSWRNWRRGCIEYRQLCDDDGMGIVRRWARYTAMTYGYGAWKKMRGELSGNTNIPIRRRRRRRRRR